MDISFGKLRKGFTVEHAAIAALGLNPQDVRGIQRGIDGINNDIDLRIIESDRANSLSEKLEAIQEIIVALQQELDAWRFGDHTTCLEFFLKIETCNHGDIYIDYSRSTLTRASLRQWFAENGISTAVFNAPESRKEGSHSPSPEPTPKIVRLENHIKKTESDVQPVQPSCIILDPEVESAIFAMAANIYMEYHFPSRDALDTLIEENEQLKGSLYKTPDYLNPEHACFSLKLAIAINAWKAVAANPPENTITVKVALKKWLLTNSVKVGLIHNGQTNNLACEEMAKVANWNQKGGVAKTL